jgi:hypothetical protein
MIISAVTAVLALVSITAVGATTGGDLGKVRGATIQFRDIEAAQAAGYGLIPGLDHCFEKPGTGAMGYHYIDALRLDLTVELLRPEAMVYAPEKDGELKLAAVEYIVPAKPWDDAGNPLPPTLMGESFHLNEALGVYVLHAWIFKNNETGIFKDWNPDVSCP